MAWREFDDPYVEGSFLYVLCRNSARTGALLRGVNMLSWLVVLGKRASGQTPDYFSTCVHVLMALLEAAGLYLLVVEKRFHL